MKQGPAQYLLLVHSFSDPGSVLCGVGKDRHNKTHIILWNTTSLMSGLIKGPTITGEVIVLSQAHTDINITTMKIAHFDEKRFIYIHTVEPL